MQRPGTLAARPSFDGAQGRPFDDSEAVERAPSDVAQGNSEPVGAANPRPVSLQFPKERRIRRRGEFGTVFERGTRIHGRFFTFLMLPSGLAGSRLGIVASRKLGGAVERNRAKRLIREFFRRLTPPAGMVAAVDLVVIPKRELLAADFSPLSKDFGNTWRRGVERLAANSRG